MCPWGVFVSSVLALTRVVNGQAEHARMDLVFNLNGLCDVSIVCAIRPWFLLCLSIWSRLVHSQVCARRSDQSVLHSAISKQQHTVRYVTVTVTSVVLNVWC